MKIRKSYIVIILLLLFILGSSYRFIQLNKERWGKEFYTQAAFDSTFNINGINFGVDKLELIGKVDEQGSTDLKLTVNLYKDGEISSKGFEKVPFYKYYYDSIILNITYKNKGILVDNYVIGYEEDIKDNQKYAEIIKGIRELGEEKEELILTYRIDKDIMEGIYKDSYDTRLVFPQDDKGLKLIFMEVNLKELL